MAERFAIGHVETKLRVCGVGLDVVRVESAPRANAAALARIVVAATDGGGPLALIRPVVAALVGYAAGPVVVIGAAQGRLRLASVGSGHPRYPLGRLLDALPDRRQLRSRLGAQPSPFADGGPLRAERLGWLREVARDATRRMAGDMPGGPIRFRGCRRALTATAVAPSRPANNAVVLTERSADLGGRLCGVCLAEPMVPVDVGMMRARNVSDARPVPQVDGRYGAAPALAIHSPFYYAVPA
jgi:hypothetical protein